MRTLLAAMGSTVPRIPEQSSAGTGLGWFAVVLAGIALVTVLWFALVKLGRNRQRR